MHLRILDLQVIGDYQVDGYYANETVSGSGTVEITANENYIDSPVGMVTFKLFEVTADGFVDLLGTTVTLTYYADHTGNFQGFLAGGYEDTLETILANRHKDMFQGWNCPLMDYLQAFLQMFSQTSYSEIINS